MTVIVAVKCPDGVVLATDSQATSQVAGNIPVKLTARKIERLGRHVVYGGTGGQGAGQRIHAALHAHSAKMNASKSASEIADVIRRTVNPIQQQIRSEWVQLPNTQPDSWGAIFCGWSREGPWIFEVDVDGKTQFQDPFASTGSGYPLAFTALISVAHFNVGQQQLEATKAIAYRAIENTCLSSAYGVGMPVQMAVVTEAGIEEINDGEPKHIELSDLIDLWKAKEVETLGALKPVLAIDDQTDGPAAEPSLDEAEIDAPGPAETPAP